MKDIVQAVMRSQPLNLIRVKYKVYFLILFYDNKINNSAIKRSISDQNLE